MNKSKIEYLEFYKNELGNGNHCTKSFGLAVWQHQQAKVEELQKRVDTALRHLDDVCFPPDYEDAWDSFYKAEKALKRGG